jgi:hypothetical protein
MARGHGRILTSIWEDADFLALDEREQRLYLFLISQPNLNHAGLLDLTLKRWARKALGLTVADLEERINALAKARFVVVDDGTEELLIRSFVRNDGVWRMPKVMGAMVSGALEISSPLLRRALLDEMDRVPLDELSNEPTKTTKGAGPSIRAQVSEHISTLRKAFGNPTPDPTQGGSGTPSVTPSGTPSEPPAEGPPKPSTHGRAATHVRAAPTPAPAPTPNPSPVNPSATAADRFGGVPGAAAVVETGGAVPDRMTDAFLDRYARGNAYGRRQVRRTIADALANGTDPDELWKALLRLGEISKPVSAGTLQFAFAEIRAASNVTPIRPSTTDARVAAGLALAEKYLAEEERAALEGAPIQPQESA